MLAKQLVEASSVMRKIEHETELEKKTESSALLVSEVRERH